MPALFRLKRPIGPDHVVDPDDTVRTKAALARLGYFEAPEEGITPWPDTPMITAIMDFQRASGLEPDGVINRGGPTEQAINERLGARVSRHPSRRPDGRQPAATLDDASPVTLASAASTAPLDSPAGATDEPQVAAPQEGRQDPLAAFHDHVQTAQSGLGGGAGSSTKRSQSGGSVITQEFRDRLAAEESRDQQNQGYSAKNAQGYLGRYQLGTLALIDAGFKDRSGKWTGKHGVRNDADFLNDPQAQEKALVDYHLAQRRQLRNLGASRFIGQRIQGLYQGPRGQHPRASITITEAGLAAAAHREGAPMVRDYLREQQKNGWDSRKYIGHPDEKKFRHIETRLRQFQSFTHRNPAAGTNP